MTEGKQTERDGLCLQWPEQTAEVLRAMNYSFSRKLT